MLKNDLSNLFCFNVDFSVKLGIIRVMN